ncbi:MAG: DUF3109 family protein [Bacteroidota bacterium]
MFPKGRKKKKRAFEGVVQVGNKLVSGEVIEEAFACDLMKCKGACCVEGDLGAPLEREELEIMDQIYEEVEPYMREEGKRVVQEQGKYVLDFTREYSTPLVEGRECAYVTFNEQGLALCAIEQAWADGKIDFQKPVSCHLYPIRITAYKDFDAINYDRWSICADACNKGEASGIRVFEFTKSALIRKYGQEFYDALVAIVAQREKEQESDEM